MESYTKEEINNMFKNYYTKSETYNKEEINQTITNSVNLDKI